MNRSLILAARWAIGLGWAFTIATSLIWIWGGEDDRWASTGVVVGAAVFSATLACALIGWLWPMESGPFARLPKPARRDDT